MIPIAKPFIPLQALQNLQTVLNSGNLAQGIWVQKIEHELAHYCGVQYGVAVSNGTTALHLALLSLGIGPGDEVITSPLTFIATINAILMVGAIPVFADVNPLTFNIEPSEVQKRISPRTKAILGVDLYGHPYCFDELEVIARAHRLYLIEDACQAMGAVFRGKRAGSLGHVSVFSFYATKHITSGEGGMVMTSDLEIVERLRSLRNHGFSQKGLPTEMGFNYRLSDLQAAILMPQVEELEKNILARRSNAEFFRKHIHHPDLDHPYADPLVEHSYSLYTFKSKSNREMRDKWVSHLNENGVESKIYYTPPMHLYPHLSSFNYKKGDFPVAEMLSDQLFSIPVHHHLSNEELLKIVELFSVHP